MFFDQSYKEPRWFKNLFINLNIKIDHKLNTKNLENQSKDFFFLNEKNKIIDLILKKSSNLNLESKKTFVKKIEKIEKIFFETENFHLNQKYVLEYIRILLKDFA
jgi:hypothetical protein